MVPPASIDELYRRHASALEAFARLKGASADDAPEVVNDAFMRLARYGAREKIENDLAFMRTIIVNIIRDRFRRTRNAPKVVSYDDADLDLPDDRQAGQEQAMIGKEALKLTLNDISDLPEPAQDVFIRYRLRRQTLEEVARETSMTIALVRRHLRDALVQLTEKRGQREQS